MAENNNIISKMLSVPTIGNMKAKTDPAISLKAETKGFNSIFDGMMSQNAKQANKSIGNPMNCPDQPRTREKMSVNSFERKQASTGQGQRNENLTTSKTSRQFGAKQKDFQDENKNLGNDIQTGSSSLINPMERPDLAESQVSYDRGNDQVAETQSNENEPRVINVMNGEENQAVDSREPRVVNAMDNSQNDSEESQIVSQETEVVAALDGDTQENGEGQNVSDNSGRIFNVMSENGNEDIDLSANTQVSEDTVLESNGGQNNTRIFNTMDNSGSNQDQALSENAVVNGEEVVSQITNTDDRVIDTMTVPAPENQDIDAETDVQVPQAEDSEVNFGNYSRSFEHNGRIFYPINNPQAESLDYVNIDQDVDVVPLNEGRVIDGTNVPQEESPELVVNSDSNTPGSSGRILDSMNIPAGETVEINVETEAPVNANIDETDVVEEELPVNLRMSENVDDVDEIRPELINRTRRIFDTMNQSDEDANINISVNNNVEESGDVNSEEIATGQPRRVFDTMSNQNENNVQNANENSQQAQANETVTRVINTMNPEDNIQNQTTNVSSETEVAEPTEPVSQPDASVALEDEMIDEAALVDSQNDIETMEDSNDDAPRRIFNTMGGNAENTSDDQIVAENLGNELNRSNRVLNSMSDFDFIPNQSSSESEIADFEASSFNRVFDALNFSGRTSRSQNVVSEMVPNTGSESQIFDTMQDLNIGSERSNIDKFNIESNPLRSSAPVSEAAATEAAKNIDPLEMIDRIANITKLAVNRKMNRISMQLNPPELGKLQVELVFRGGAMSASLKTESAAAQQALQTNINHLREALAQQGVQVNNIDLQNREDLTRQSSWQGNNMFDQSGSSNSNSRGSGHSSSNPDSYIPAPEVVEYAQPSLADGLNLVV